VVAWQAAAASHAKVAAACGVEAAKTADDAPKSSFKKQGFMRSTRIDWKQRRFDK
jgi:hypothetical protein